MSHVLFDEVRTQPGVSGIVPHPALRDPRWSMVIAEHHIAGPLRVDLMGCTTDPWDVDVDGLPPQSLAEEFALYWFEWDHVDGRSLRAPLWSVSVDRRLLGAPPWPSGEHARRMGRVLTLLGMPGEPRHALEHAIDSLHGGGTLLHIAPLEPRGGRGFRTSWTVRAGSVGAWLAEIGHPADRSSLGAMLLRLAPLDGQVGVQLEVGRHGIGDYLAIEVPPTWQGRPVPSQDLSPWLSLVPEAGRVRTEALRSWVEAGSAIGTRQMYMKLTRKGTTWVPKVYAGVTVSV